ncbi:MAG: hypothetical protein CMJ88_02240 [Planctomycetes bacterium]|nr:hypothetical protein [Planctomycetota bacterium]
MTVAAALAAANQSVYVSALVSQDTSALACTDHARSKALFRRAQGMLLASSAIPAGVVSQMFCVAVSMR